MARIKVLPLTFPFNLQKELWDECVKESDRIEPRFKRNGYYLDRDEKRAWLEINGEAWNYSTKEQFDYELAVSEGNNWLDDRVFDALHILVTHRDIADKRLRELFMIEFYKREHRKVHRDASLFAYKIQKEWRELKQSQEAEIDKKKKKMKRDRKKKTRKT